MFATNAEQTSPRDNAVNEQKLRQIKLPIRHTRYTCPIGDVGAGRNWAASSVHLPRVPT